MVPWCDRLTLLTLVCEVITGTVGPSPTKSQKKTWSLIFELPRKFWRLLIQAPPGERVVMPSEAGSVVATNRQFFKYIAAEAEPSPTPSPAVGPEMPHTPKPPYRTGHHNHQPNCREKTMLKCQQDSTDVNVRVGEFHVSKFTSTLT